MFTHRGGKNGFTFLLGCNVFERTIVIYLYVTPGVTEYFPWSLEKNEYPHRKDLILAHTGKSQHEKLNLRVRKDGVKNA